jgi:(2Fe-2S) ferredoxin
MAGIEMVGFDRPKTAPLAGSVSFYQRHLYVCTGQDAWPAQIATDGGFLQALSEAIAARAMEMPLQVKLNACDAPSECFGWDVMVFPDGIRYLGLTEADIPALVEEQLVGNHIAEDLPHAPLAGQHIFVCVHMNRDPRCGACGPALAEKFARELESRGLQNEVFLHRSSHVGGHEYAANALIYPGGDWYGYLVPDDVPGLVERHILGGQIVTERWRGRMGLTREEQMQEAARRRA